MDRYPAAYLRRSKVELNSPGDISYADQEAGIRALAHRDGFNGELHMFVDWDRSGDEAKVARRTEFTRLLRAVAAGEIAVLYGAKLDRLGRSIIGTSRLLAACKDRDVRVVTVAEGDLSDDGNPARWAYTTLISFFSEYELRMAKARSQGSATARRRRGDHMGPPPFGYRVAAGKLVPEPSQPVAAVLDAFRTAGSFNGAASILNRDRVPTRNGHVATDVHPVWWATAVRLIVDREAPGMVPPKVRRGAPAMGHFLLAGLLHCGFCQRILTAKRDRGSVYYVCGNAARDPNHPRPLQAAERAVQPWVQDEIAHVDLGGDRTEAARDDATQRAKLAGKLERANELFVLGPSDGGWTRERFDQEKTSIAAALDKLGDAVVVVDLGNLDDLWTWVPADTNATLRAILERVDLGADMLPTSATWRNPALRRACDDPACTHCPRP
jgi:DNA invertase Pin-like site-specific DNA recombinase